MFRAVAIFHMLFFGQPVDVVYDVPSGSIEQLDTRVKCLAFASSESVVTHLKYFVYRYFDDDDDDRVIQQIEPACVLVTHGA